MITVTLPTELATPLAEEARRRGTTPENLALEVVRRMLPPSPEHLDPGPKSLLDSLAGHVGVVAGTDEAFSLDCGRRFAEGLAADRAARP
jgi:hypothetical protein